MTLIEFLQRDVAKYPVEEILDNLTTDQLLDEFRAFAKMHVSNALNSASKSARTYHKSVSDGFETWEFEAIDEDSIINSYPLDKIK